MSILRRRTTAKIAGDFVVLLIGARLNKWWKLGQFKWVGDAMKRMVTELEAKPESGFLGVESWLSLSPVMIQYWRSPEHLMAYARNRDAEHYPVWVGFNRDLAKHGDVGIWHETYIVKAGNYECVYNNMPRFGLAKVATMQDAQGSLESAAGRLGRTDGTDGPISPDGLERG
jgi:Domain of unknown function (DUF4188)